MTLLQDRATKPVLEILAISDHEWRVCDGRFAQRDAPRMLGYIDRTSAGYELVRLQHEPRVQIFDSLKGALDALIEPSSDELPGG
ncbi:hypothetical protein [Mycetocola zhadangensis]|nr:hypothetical protein [Mycetocola zhadangensis]